MARLKGLHETPMWEGFAKHQLLLQRCRSCSEHRFPPGAACPACLSPDYDWIPASGEAEIISWAIFHRQYLPSYPVPYNVIAVRLAEGPLTISNLVGSEPTGSWIGQKVELVWRDTEGEGALPRFQLR